MINQYRATSPYREKDENIQLEELNKYSECQFYFCRYQELIQHKIRRIAGDCYNGNSAVMPQFSTDKESNSKQLAQSNEGGEQKIFNKNKIYLGFIDPETIVKKSNGGGSMNNFHDIFNKE